MPLRRRLGSMQPGNMGVLSGRSIDRSINPFASIPWFHAQSSPTCKQAIKQAIAMPLPMRLATHCQMRHQAHANACHC